ncbi:MAG TPA: MBOAT family O-acyltransferase [Planctomycetota bacterium]|nr:MBOAT family O-acyltransferase [Planctomycetota bacterium]
MLFSSTLFLFLFLPLVLTLYHAFGVRAKNTVLLVSSLVFYAWGEAWMVLLMLLSILANYGFGLWVERARETGPARLQVTLAVVFNLGLLFLFKYADWLWMSLGGLLAGHPIQPLGGLLVTSDLGRSVLLTGAGHLRLPLGISFFTFQAMSYVIDVSRREVPAERNPASFALYISLFPQLIAGPIVRYRDVAAQLVDRSETLTRFASGLRRFIIGLGKKVLLANIAGATATEIFSANRDDVTMPVAWIGLFAYWVQLYFDFSGYSDMAIGLGRMFGFEFLENFNYPYIAQSLTDFWRRWHISLSTWFRDYLFIPMGGSRGSPLRTYFNLATVFILCALWHGAEWNYLVFGCFQGSVLVFERAWFGAKLEKWPRALRHVYLQLVIAISWVLFRSEDLSLFPAWLAAMFGMSKGNPALVYPALYLDSARELVLVAGLIGAMPWLPKLKQWLDREPAFAWRKRLLGAGSDLLLCAILLLCSLELSAGTFNPFIYFRF